MLCPYCHKPINAAALLGSKGGKAVGASKVRNVDYSAMAKLSHQKRRENKAKH